MTTDYKTDTITKIRKSKLPKKLRKKSDEEISSLYASYSNKYSAGWLILSDVVLGEFIKWAVTAPCERN